MAQVILEDDIFKYLIDRPEDMDILRNVRAFLTTVPINIFKDEYYILYKAIDFGYRYNMVITLEHLEQLVISNMDELLKDRKVTLYKEDSKEYTDQERAELIQQMVSSTYMMLEDMDVNDNGYTELLFNIKLYVDSWAEEEYGKTIIAQNTILREGKRYNNRLYKGVEDANAYYNKKYDIIRGLIDGGVDRLSDVIDTSVDSPDDIRSKQEEEDYEIIAKTGVDDWDKLYPLARGEMIVIQGGSGVGKTRQAINIGYNAMVEYKSNVLVLSLEQISTRIWPMFVARHSVRFAEDQSSWLDDEMIIRRSLNSNQQLFKNIVEDDLITNQEYGKVRVEGINLHASDVRRHLEKVWEDGFHFDVVILDYIGILQTNGGSRYDLLTNVVNELKAECKTFKGTGFLAVLPNQLSREVEKELIQGNYDSTRVGGSETGYLRRGANYVLTVHQTEDMKITNRMMWLIDKVRLGSPQVRQINLLAFQGQCLYLSDDLEDVEEEELI